MSLNESKPSSGTYHNTITLFDEILNGYYFHRDCLIKWRKEMLPMGTVVKNEDNIWAIVVESDDCPPDKIALQFENGNVWWKTLKEYTAITDKTQWPEYIKRMKQNS